MPLLSVFAADPRSVDELTIEQVVSIAGQGVLTDQSQCSSELRQFLAQVGIGKIEDYVSHCLGTAFSKGGMVLQDLVNEVGRRLDYDVTNGRYQGIASAIGFDGLWTAPEGNCLIVEVKTTDTYRLSLDTLANYRRRVTEAGHAKNGSSILIVVGREDTGELEAQIRGSRHAWDVRLISAEALIKLALLKEASEERETGLKIRSLLSPKEFTRLDELVEVMFATVSDVEAPETEHADPEESGKKSTSASQMSRIEQVRDATDPKAMQAKRQALINSLSAKEGTPLIRKSRALYWSGDRATRVASAISKIYRSGTQPGYWYAFHPQWNEFLAEGDQSFFVLGCMDRDHAFAIPLETLRPILPRLHTTTKDERTYWHIRLAAKGDCVELTVPKEESIALDPFRFNI